MNCYRDFSSVTVTFRHGVPKKQFHSLNKNWRRLSKRFPSLYRSKLWNNSLFLVKIFIGDGEFFYFLYCTCCCVLFKNPWFITFWPINVFYAQVVTVWVWCSSLCVWGGPSHALPRLEPLGPGGGFRQGNGGGIVSTADSLLKSQAWRCPRPEKRQNRKQDQG